MLANEKSTSVVYFQIS